MNDTDGQELRREMHELDALIESFEQRADPAMRDQMQQIVRTLLAFHAAGLQRVLDHLSDRRELIESLANDDLVSSLLVLHDLHPHDLPTRVAGALEKVKPYLASHGGHVELLSASPEDGIVRLRLEGSCHGCPSSRATLQSSIEQEILAAAPEVSSIVVEGLVEEPPPPAPASGFVPVSINGAAPRQKGDITDYLDRAAIASP